MTKTDLGEDGGAQFALALKNRIAGSGVLIAVDGPSGSGKSTVSKRVATALGIAFLETGAMYRALTWLCMQDGVDLGDADAVLAKADDLHFSSVGTVEKPCFMVGERDVTDALRSVEVAGNVSVVAGYIPVRKWMAKEQRRQMLAAREDGRGMIAEGRDITTVVCPDADVRVLLLADPEARLRRRVMETYGHVTPELMEKTRVLVSGRDQEDSKVSAFMAPAPGVVAIDSSEKPIDEVEGEVMALVSAWASSRAGA